MERRTRASSDPGHGVASPRCRARRQAHPQRLLVQNSPSCGTSTAPSRTPSAAHRVGEERGCRRQPLSRDILKLYNVNDGAVRTFSRQTSVGSGAAARRLRFVTGSGDHTAASGPWPWPRINNNLTVPHGSSPLRRRPHPPAAARFCAAFATAAPGRRRPPPPPRPRDRRRRATPAALGGAPSAPTRARRRAVLAAVPRRPPTPGSRRSEPPAAGDTGARRARLASLSQRSESCTAASRCARRRIGRGAAVDASSRGRATRRRPRPSSPSRSTRRSPAAGRWRRRVDAARARHRHRRRLRRRRARRRRRRRLVGAARGVEAAAEVAAHAQLTSADAASRRAVSESRADIAPPPLPGSCGMLFGRLAPSATLARQPARPPAQLRHRSRVVRSVPHCTQRRRNRRHRSPRRPAAGAPVCACAPPESGGGLGGAQPHRPRRSAGATPRAVQVPASRRGLPGRRPRGMAPARESSVGRRSVCARPRRRGGRRRRAGDIRGGAAERRRRHRRTAAPSERTKSGPRGPRRRQRRGRRGGHARHRRRAAIRSQPILLEQTMELRVRRVERGLECRNLCCCDTSVDSACDSAAPQCGPPTTTSPTTHRA